MLASIRWELNISIRKKILNNVLKIFKIDVFGCYEEMKNNPEFSYELSIIACEYGISSF